MYGTSFLCMHATVQAGASVKNNAAQCFDEACLVYMAFRRLVLDESRGRGGGVGFGELRFHAPLPACPPFY